MALKIQYIEKMGITSAVSAGLYLMLHWGILLGFMSLVALRPNLIDHSGVGGFLGWSFFLSQFCGVFSLISSLLHLKYMDEPSHWSWFGLLLSGGNLGLFIIVILLMQLSGA